MLQVQALWSPIPRQLPYLGVLRRCQATVPENVPQSNRVARYWTCGQPSFSKSRVSCRKPSASNWHPSSDHPALGERSGLTTSQCTNVWGNSWNHYPRWTTNVCWQKVWQTIALDGCQSSTTGHPIAAVIGERTSAMTQIYGWLSNVGSVSFILLMGGRCIRCWARMQTIWLRRRIWRGWRGKIHDYDTIWLADIAPVCATPSRGLMLKCSLRLLLHYLKERTVPLPA